MEDTILSVEKLYFRYPNQSDYAVQNVTFQVKRGEWLAIVGHNGSGKSTIAKLLIGLLKPESGVIKLFHHVLDEQTVWEIRRRIGMVFQNPDNQFVGTTVEDDVAFALENNGIPRDEMVKRVHEAIRQVQMEEFLHHEPHHLSGGQKQRVAIAGILALRPDLIILDEATSMLDPKGRQEVFDTVRNLNKKQRITVLSITHDLEEVAKADRVIVMNKGEMMAEGTPKQIFALGTKLERIGLDLPFAVKVRERLKQRGIPLSSSYFTIEELVEELWTLYLKR
ncbi:MAG: energy-coupling factor ABC transporter ATP-binding protein [Geobacillus sp.]|uniref:Energy-coupling factor ABC transporter ATP-binding protein n=1 Tax=Parageobacillus thermoglucosidasius TaxID=1426 RepID=A0AB38QXC0_PARTM|nr:energy-coupling factor ABC transporter ATP-binding protein [Parageobacillus thermoglucosidasius]REK53425.1 MAG: energy-coupling factor ABC transporter ATP-binding protein [Geobacillus sp.]UOE76237.1 energy-coupling factor ABC transporter ATP-binding protein [Parageobacillus thermoglucosidasius]GCD84743.1 energy-coupling factor transporter ATP-binding protein EcfA1 [Parageobacillus thermoglucosidasius]